MAITTDTRSKVLNESPSACCPLCNAVLPTRGLLHTPDFVIFVRDGCIAQFTVGEATVFRALFKAKGFRQSRGQLVDSMYAGSEVPLNAEHVLRLHCKNINAKLRLLNMGIITDGGIASMVFTSSDKKVKDK